MKKSISWWYLAIIPIAHTLLYVLLWSKEKDLHISIAEGLGGSIGLIGIPLIFVSFIYIIQLIRKKPYINAAKHTLILYFIFFVFSTYLHFEEMQKNNNISIETHHCNIQWYQINNQKFAPPDDLKTVKIDIITFHNGYIGIMNESDVINVTTGGAKKTTSTFKYQSFIDHNDYLGMSYQSKNGKILDLYQDGVLILWLDNKTPLVKAICPTVDLKIRKITTQ